jgi:stage III sporulation protein AH
MGMKRKQIVVISLVLMILIAGYVQYTYKRSSVSTSEKEVGKLGEAVFVENNEAVSIDNESTTSSSDLKASKLANNYFTQAKLDKEVARSKDTDDLRSITEDVNATTESKNKAYEDMMSIINESQKELKIETLVKKIGFSDAIALIGEDNSVDVVVKAPRLLESEISKITDIVVREAKADINGIVIKNYY